MFIELLYAVYLSRDSCVVHCGQNGGFQDDTIYPSLMDGKILAYVMCSCIDKITFIEE